MTEQIDATIKTVRRLSSQLRPGMLDDLGLGPSVEWYAQEFQARTGIEVVPVEQVGLDGDMLEAQAFAYLAVRVARGLPTSAPSTTGVPACLGGGRMSRPEALALQP